MMRFVCTTAAALLACSAAVAVPTNTNNDAFVETWDCYANGTDLEATWQANSQMSGPNNINEWRGWDQTAAATGIVTNAQARSAPHSVEITAGSDLIRQFMPTYEAYSEGHWAAIVWMYVPSGLSTDSYFIMLNQYTDGAGQSNLWSVQMRFDPLLGVVESEYDGIQLPIIFDEWVRIAVDINLDVDLHTVYYGPSVFYTKNWTDGPNNLGNGSTDIAVFDLFANGASPVYYDDITVRREPSCPGDTDGNGTTDTDDFLNVLGKWAPTGPTGAYTQPDCQIGCGPYGIADTDEDCDVDTDDFLAVLGGWANCNVPGACCYPDQSCLVQTPADCFADGGSFQGTFNDCTTIACPLNDRCSRAAPIIIDDPCTLANNCDATLPGADDAAIDDCQSGTISGPVLWYTVVGNGNLLQASACNIGTATSQDPFACEGDTPGGWDNALNISVYCGICEFLSCVGPGSNTDCLIPGGLPPDDFGPQVDWCSRDGEIYYIAVYGSSDADRSQFCLSVTDEGDCGVIEPPTCWCTDVGCVDDEGEELANGGDCYPDWDGTTPVEDTYNGGYFGQCPTLNFSDNFDAGGSNTVCGSASYFISPIRQEVSDDCIAPIDYSPLSFNVRDTDWYRMSVPDNGDGGTAATITLYAEFIAAVIIWDDSCKSDGLLNTDGVLVSYSFTNADADNLATGGRCATATLTVPWLKAGSDYILYLSNIDGTTIECSNSQYEMSIAYAAGTAPETGCQVFDIDQSWVASTSDINFRSIEGPVVAADDIRVSAADTLTSLYVQHIDRKLNAAGDAFEPCNAPEAQFRIQIWQDGGADGCPDTLLHDESNVVAAATDTGEDFIGFNVWENTIPVTGGPVLSPGNCYYVVVYGDKGLPCEFLWMGDARFTGNNYGTSYTVDNHYTDPIANPWDPTDPANWACDPAADANDFDFVMCLGGALGPIPLDGDICICLP